MASRGELTEVAVSKLNSMHGIIVAKDKELAGLREQFAEAELALEVQKREVLQLKAQVQSLEVDLRARSTEVSSMQVEVRGLNKDLSILYIKLHDTVKTSTSTMTCESI